MRREEYIRSVLRASGLPRSVCRRLHADLESDLAARLEQGETMEQAIAAMGAPEQLGAELREVWAPRPRSRREKGLLAAALVLALLLAGSLIWILAEWSVLQVLASALTGQPASIPPAADVGVIGGADGPTAIFVTGGANALLLGCWCLLAVGLVICLLLYRRWRSRG